MTAKEAIRLLDPETTRDALWEIEYYGGFNGKEAQIKAIEDACVLAVEALRKMEETKGTQEGVKIPVISMSDVPKIMEEME